MNKKIKKLGWIIVIAIYINAISFVVSVLNYIMFKIFSLWTFSAISIISLAVSYLIIIEIELKTAIKQ